MLIETPEKTIKHSRSMDEGKEGLHLIFGLRRRIARSLLENIDKQITQEHLKEAVEFLSEVTEMDIEVSFVEKLLILYPPARIAIGVAEGVHGDSEAREELLFAFTHFVLGCTWPTYGDKINPEEFLALLQKQYSLLLKEV